MIDRRNRLAETNRRHVGCSSRIKQCGNEQLWQGPQRVSEAVRQPHWLRRRSPP